MTDTTESWLENQADRTFARQRAQVDSGHRSTPRNFWPLSRPGPRRRWSQRNGRRGDARVRRALALIAAARRRSDEEAVSVDHPPRSEGRSDLFTILDLEAGYALGTGQQVALALFAFHHLDSPSPDEAALRDRVSDLFERFLRSSDLLIPRDPDRFAMIFRGAGRAGGVTIARTLVDLIGRTPLQDVPIGASVGMALCPRDGQTSHELVSVADEALTKAREAGPGSIFIGRSIAPESEDAPRRSRTAES